MATKFKFPIRYKILAVLSVVVVAAVAVYLYLASKLFYEDKTELIYELNQNNVRALAGDVRADLGRVLDKLKLIAALTAAGESANSRAFEAGFADDNELVKVAVLEKLPEDRAPRRTFVKVWPKYLESYKKDSAYLDRLRDSIPVPFEKIVARGIWVRNGTLAEENSAPIMTVATGIESEGGAKSAQRVIYADVRLDHILETFSSGGIARVFLTDSEGHALSHSEQERVRAGEDLSKDPLVQKAVSSNVRSEVTKYEHGGKSYLGSYFQVGLGGLIVASNVEADEAFAAAERLIRKSLIFAVIVVTTAFLIALFFSHTLTAPIQKMLEATQRIARGDFNRLIHVSSHDELATLAASFNSMTTDLRASREQIEEYSRDLEKKVQDRTARLEASNVAIKEAQEALVRTTRLASVGEIAGRAAHEVLNPLTNVTARLEKMQTAALKADRDDLALFREIVEAWAKELQAKGKDGLLQSLAVPSKTQPGKTMLDEDIENLAAIASDVSKRVGDRQGDLDFLLREAGRINKIVNGMRQLTRVSGNRRAVDIHALLDEAVSTMSDVLRKNKITVETRYCDAKPAVLADHDELLQVFSNLMRNSMQAIQEALKAAQPVGQPPKVWFTTELVAQGDRQSIYIRVGDNGPGIAPENLSRVFDSSFTTKSAEDGTGLGLSIARRFIRAYDGEIIVEKSVPGVETVFLIELPQLRSDGPTSH